jgi:hypothetical protein
MSQRVHSSDELWIHLSPRFCLTLRVLDEAASTEKLGASLGEDVFMSTRTVPQLFVE